MNSRQRESRRIWNAMPPTVKAALNHAMQAGVKIDIGYGDAFGGRQHPCIVRGEVPDHVAVVLTLARFKKHKNKRTGPWWGWRFT